MSVYMQSILTKENGFIAHWPLLGDFFFLFRFIEAERNTLPYVAMKVHSGPHTGPYVEILYGDMNGQLIDIFRTVQSTANA